MISLAIERCNLFSSWSERFCKLFWVELFHEWCSNCLDKIPLAQKVLKRLSYIGTNYLGETIMIIRFCSANNSAFLSEVKVILSPETTGGVTDLLKFW